jgi:hypothetical protein
VIPFKALGHVIPRSDEDSRNRNVMKKYFLKKIQEEDPSYLLGVKRLKSSDYDNSFILYIKSPSPSFSFSKLFAVEEVDDDVLQLKSSFIRRKLRKEKETTTQN